MPEIYINYPILLLAAAASFVLGFLWHGPLFGKTWVRLSGITEKEIEEARAKGFKGMAKPMVLGFLGNILMGYVLYHSLIFASAYLKASGPTAGLMCGFWNWLGFIVPVTLNGVLWEKRSWKLWGFSVTYLLASLLLMGVILSVWGM